MVVVADGGDHDFDAAAAVVVAENDGDDVGIMAIIAMMVYSLV